MGKKIAVYTSVSLGLTLSLAFLNPASSHHQRIVLGDSTTSAAQLPPTTEGPGLILPDSPLFFLDEIKQNIRLLFALTPEAKAKIHNSIAGERLAELRIMLNNNNKKGAEKALIGAKENFAKVSSNIAEAQLSGRDVSKVAREINDNIKTKQKSLTELDPEFKEIDEMLLETKVEVEDGLPEQELENEIEEDLNRKVQHKVEEADRSVKEIKDILNELDREAKDAIQKSLKRREDAIKKAIEEKNETLRKVAERLFENEKKKQEMLMEAKDKVAEQARHAIEKAQEAAQGFKRAQEAVREIKNSSNSSESSSSSSDSSSSGSSESKNSDSDNSGSGSSGSGKE